MVCYDYLRQLNNKPITVQRIGHMTITAGNLNVIFQLKTAETIKGKIGKSGIVTDRNYQIDIGNVISNTTLPCKILSYHQLSYCLGES